LHAAYDAKVVGYCMWKYGLSRADVEDLWQEVLISIYQHANQFRQDADAETWIWSLVRHRAIDLLRKPGRRYHREPSEGESTEIPVPPSDQPTRVNIDDCVHRGLQNFGRDHGDEAMAISLRDLIGWDIPTMAAYLGRSETATRSFLSSLRKKLRPFMEPCLELLSSDL
jgi:RNA polymerase sigma factor (sigma-70 family)